MQRFGFELLIGSSPQPRVEQTLAARHLKEGGVALLRALDAACIEHADPGAAAAVA
jgi:hypothetical protein